MEQGAWVWAEPAGSEVISGLLTTRIPTLSWNKLVLIVGLSLLLRP